MSGSPHEPGARTPAVRPADHPVDPAVEEAHSLVELVNRVLDRGVVLHGDVTISVAGVDLVYLGLSALLTSVATARRTLAAGTARVVPGTLPLPPEPPRADLPAAAAGPLQEEQGAGRSATGARTVETESDLAQQASELLGARLAEVSDSLPSQLDIDPDAVQRDLARLVLTLVELLRRVVEHQAVRRMEDDDLSEAQVERMGLALQRLEEKLAEIKGVFGLADDELNIDLGPLGRLL